MERNKMASAILMLLQGILVTHANQDFKSYFEIKNDCYKSYNKTDNQVIKTPNFDYGDYPDNQECGWLIESPEPSAEIKVNFHFFELESAKRCHKYDYVMLYKQNNNADYNQWEPVLDPEGYCSKQTNLKVEQTTKRIFIKFRSDNSARAKGFNATFTIYVTSTAPKIHYLGEVNGMTAARLSQEEVAFNVTIEETDEVTIQCRAEATPPPDTYTWEYMRFSPASNWSILEESNYMVKNIFPNGSIRLHHLLMTDTGNVQCTAANRNQNTTEMVPLNVKQKCNCPKYISTSWYNFPPYTEFPVDKDLTKGIYPAILNDMVQNVCGDCKGGHGKTEIIWNYEENRDVSTRGLSDVKGEIENGETDIYFPISGGKNDDQYRNMFYFLPMVDSPGVAFLIVGAEEGAAAKVIFDSILQGWPILVLLVVMSALAGIIMWMLDTYWNPEQFPRNFSEGIVEGFWWAFVTMTTVGYGDIAPVGVPGRLFAVIWILTGLVIIAIFTGVITTSLTVIALESNVKLYGATVAAINNTAEFRMGVVKNAKMLNYSSFDTLQESMIQRKVNGCLIDSYVAAYHKSKFKSFRVNNIFPSTKAFGIVLGKRMSKKYLYDLFQDYLEKNKAKVTKFIESNTYTLEAEDGSAASEAAGDLFDPGSALFQSALRGCLILLVILSAGGLLFEYCYLRPRHRMIKAAKNLEMVESIEVKEMALRARLLKETLLYEVGEFYDRWSEKLGYLTGKHKEEQKTLLTKGASPGPAPARQWQAPPGEEVIVIQDDQRPESSSNSSSGGSVKSLVKKNETGI